MTREGHSLSHESPSYKVHDHPHTSIYRCTYTMYNAITQSRKVKQALPTFQGYGPTGYRKCKIDICHTRGMQPKQSARKIKDLWRGNPDT